MTLAEIQNLTEIAPQQRQQQQLMPESFTQLENNDRLKASPKCHMTSELRFARGHLRVSAFIWEKLLHLMTVKVLLFGH